MQDILKQRTIAEDFSDLQATDGMIGAEDITQCSNIGDSHEMFTIRLTELNSTRLHFTLKILTQKT